MKRVGNLFDSIAEVDNIALAACKAFRGKSQSQEVIEFRQNFMDNIVAIRNGILSESIQVGNYRRFIVYEPKLREICAAPLAQRILQHAIMNVCHEYFERCLIYDCYASRPLKGTHKAILRVKQKSSEFKYYVKLDIRKFFDSIDHSILKNRLARLIKDKSLFRLFNRIIDSHGDGCGLPIGNLTSQYFANFYLSSVDHYMKEVVKTPVYVRYMDDVIIMAKDKAALLMLMHKYVEFVDKNLNLRVKPPIVGNINNGIPFLGYRIFRDKILMNGKGKRRFRKNLRSLGELFYKAEISEREYSNRLMSNLAYAGFADSYVFRKKLKL
ncbi:MAG: RNA-directed DNA polymerase [Bacteroides sp.]|nr:RNA-directed DNA polymerase [Bacteroides sp.]